MSKMKKYLLTGISYVLVAALAIGGTFAYLQDSDEDVNVMTLGNVQIEQHEYQRAEGVAPNATAAEGDLVPYEQGQPLYPAVPHTTDAYEAAQAEADCFHWGVYSPGWNGLWDDAKLSNVMDKFVFVENTGKTDAYYRTLIALECPEGMSIGYTGNDEINVNINGGSRFTWDYSAGYITVDGTRYQLWCVTYNEILTPGEVSRPSLLQVVLTHNATNEDMELLGGTYEILVFSQAVQAAGFDNAKQALDTAFGAVTATSHPWTNGVKIPTVVTSADALIEALEGGKDVVLADDVKIEPANMSNAYGTTGINVKNGQTVDGGNNTLNIKGAGGTWDSGINTTGGLIKDITVTGSFRGIFINHNSAHSERVVLENVTIDGTVYTISCDQGLNQGLTATNSTFNGWTSYAKTLGEAEFVDCSFGEGSGYAFCRPYAPTTFVGCDFEAGYTVDPVAAVTFENCTLNGVALTSANIADLVTSTANVTVK